MKSSLTGDTVMAYFDPLKSTELIVDASPVGLGAILTQVSKAGNVSTISYASKALTETEQRYSQTEREALAVVWGCLHFHLYLMGHKFTVISDHKPLIPLFNKHSSKPPPQLERWLLRLQNYQFRLRYEAGAGNPADYFSRHPTPQTTKDDIPATILAEEHINFIVAHSVPKAMTMEEIQQTVDSDHQLQLVIETVRSKNWSNFLAEARLQTPDQTTYLTAFFNARHALSVPDSNLLLRNNRLVIPQKLQSRVLDLAHEAHQGVVKTKQLLREKVWFPGLDKKVEALIETCIPCQATTINHRRAPLQMTPLPEGPWTAVSVDFCVLPDHSYLLVVMDDYSRFPVIEHVSTTSARAVIPKLDKIFSAYGIPETVNADNGPPFNSTDFRSFATYLGFTHRKITPYWPQANGEVERFMQSINKTLRIATMEHKDLQQELHRFLRQYRATPHSTTGVPPATALFNRPMRVKLPSVPLSPVQTPIATKDAISKQKMKRYADKSSHRCKPPEVLVGDWVLVKRLRPSDKFASRYYPEPFQVTQVKGTMVTAQDHGRQVTRNVSHFKKLCDYIPETDEADGDDVLPGPQSSAVPREDTSEDSESSSGTEMSHRYPARANRRPPAHLLDYVLQ
ncbi:tumor necrosis factor alpha-induced protein 8-like protein 3 isoform X1 [Phyllobates terribilis]|uniref:tumor necrosis factor alpha-induced protein 8-like protein 3 isoform X1 n=1 Tax=Phyllobates terribilis TaxID=111132 RepID=UPI003CCAE70F